MPFPPPTIGPMSVMAAMLILGLIWLIFAKIGSIFGDAGAKFLGDFAVCAVVFVSFAMLVNHLSAG